MKESIYFNISVAFGIIVITIIISLLVNRFLHRLIRNSTDEMKNDPLNYKFLRHSILGMIYLIGVSLAIYAVPDLRTVASSILAGAGILAVAIGFASQHALSNVVSGLFMVVFKPFKIHDRLVIKNFQGVVEDITLRHTVIRDFENKRIIIPNSVISNEIIVNADFAEEKICKWIDIHISYDSDIDLAKSIIEDEIRQHPSYLDPRSQEDLDNGVPEVVVRVLSLADSSVLIRGWAWATDAPESFVMNCDLLESIKKRFDKEGVKIPYPHRSIEIINK